MTKCKGCGAVLQNTDIKAIGYTPKEIVNIVKDVFV